MSNELRRGLPMVEARDPEALEQGKQLLATRARPYDVFWKKLHPSLALLWGFWQS